MRYNELRPERTRQKKHRPSAPPPDAGPRPLSARQRAHQAGSALLSEHAAPPPRPNSLRAEKARAEIRRKNRRRRPILRPLLRLAVAVLVAECLAALLLSPRLWVRRIEIAENETVSPEQIAARLALRPQTNLVCLPMRRLQTAVESEPAVDHAQLHRRLPGTLSVTVQERLPWAVVKTGDGICYTIDRKLVPFRKERMPAPDLPLVILETGDASAPVLGKALRSPGIAVVQNCLAWATLRDDFPLQKITVDQTGKLCLNRRGGAEVRLGSGIDLEKKLNTLAALLSDHSELRDGDFSYINLYAFDAPAIQLRSSSAKPSARATDGTAAAD